MKAIGVSDARANLSSLIAEVRQGESVVVTHRGKPVARIEPYAPPGGEMSEELRSLIAKGIVMTGSNRPDPHFFRRIRPLELPDGLDIVEYVIEERRDSR